MGFFLFLVGSLRQVVSDFSVRVMVHKLCGDDFRKQNLDDFRKQCFIFHEKLLIVIAPSIA